MQSVSDIASNYYTQMAHKNADGLEQYLHTDVTFISPLGSMHGKESVVNAARGFMTMFNSLDIKQKLKTDDDNFAAIIFYINCPNPVGTVKATTLMTIKDGLITKMELFYDPRPFLSK